MGGIFLHLFFLEWRVVICRVGVGGSQGFDLPAIKVRFAKSCEACGAIQGEGAHERLINDVRSVGDLWLLQLCAVGL